MPGRRNPAPEGAKSPQVPSPRRCEAQPEGTGRTLCPFWAPAPGLCRNFAVPIPAAGSPAPGGRGHASNRPTPTTGMERMPPTHWPSRGAGPAALPTTRM